MRHALPQPAVLLFAAALGWLGCAPPPVLKLAPGAVCARTVTAGPTAAALSDALTRAQSGTCVVATPGSYAAALSVPAGVTLGAEVGTTVEVTGGAASAPAVTLGAGSTLSGVHVVSAPGIGVSVVGAKASLVSVVVTGAHSAGVVCWCEEDCLIADPSEMRDVVLTGNAVGLLVHGARVNVVGGSVSGSHSVALASGYGVVASNGAVLEMTSTVIEGNEELGMLIDGNQGTQATLQEVTVRNNLGRGIWAQDLAGTMVAPKLQLTSCTVEGNRLVGVGARASRGLQIQGGRVAGTVVGKAASETPGVFVDVGDGVGLFANTADVRVDTVALDNNGRSQVLIDLGATGLVIQGGALTPQAGQLGVVVQHTTQAVVAPMVFTPMPGQELAVSAPSLAIPTK